MIHIGKNLTEKYQDLIQKFDALESPSLRVLVETIQFKDANKQFAMNVVKALKETKILSLKALSYSACISEIINIF